MIASVVLCILGLLAVVFALASVLAPRQCADCGRRGDLTRDKGTGLWHCRTVGRCWGPP